MESTEISKQAKQINILAYQNGETWIAQCVEYDICAFADKLPKLLKAFDRALAANVCVNTELGRDGFEGIPAAPQNIRNVFETAKMTVTNGLQSRSPIKGVIIGEMKIAEGI